MARAQRVVDVGSGQPLVLIPGIQGRWQWMRPAVRELAKRFRVATFSLTPVASTTPFQVNTTATQIAASSREQQRTARGLLSIRLMVRPVAATCHSTSTCMWYNHHPRTPDNTRSTPLNHLHSSAQRRR